MATLLLLAVHGAPARAGEVSEFDLFIEKTDSPDPIDPGQQLPYEIRVTNNGPE